MQYNDFFQRENWSIDHELLSTLRYRSITIVCMVSRLVFVTGSHIPLLVFGVDIGHTYDVRWAAHKPVSVCE